jgi:hypothetical protein
MFADLDESVRQLLIREVPLSPADVDIVFDRPDRDNVARFLKPTVDLFLFDFSENRDLRETGWQVRRNGGNSATLRWPPLRVDVRYLVSVWAPAVDDEHRLLYHLYRTLRRVSELPEEAREGLVANQEKPLHVAVEDRELRGIIDLWGVLDNSMKPGFILRATVSVDLNAAREAPVVRTATLRSRQPGRPVGTRHRAGGRVMSSDGQPIAGARVQAGKRSAVSDDTGRYRLGNLPRTGVNISVEADGFEPVTRAVTPPEDYDFNLQTSDSSRADGADASGRRRPRRREE